MRDVTSQPTAPTGFTRRNSTTSNPACTSACRRRRFVADAVEHVRAAGADVAVVSPARFRHFGIAYGGGIAQNLRARPWLAAALPAFFAAYARAARRAAREVDLVHAHWIPSGIAALATGKPFVLQVWGTDVELARRVPPLARTVVGRAEI